TTAPFYSFLHSTATTEIYTLSLHDALPISAERREQLLVDEPAVDVAAGLGTARHTEDLGLAARAADDRDVERAAAYVDGERHSRDRKSTRLNSSHVAISYAVFCLKKKTRER